MPLIDGLDADLAALVGTAGMVARSNADHLVVDERGKFRGEPVAIVRPASTDEVAAVVRTCHERDLAVVTQGGNTGLSGGSVPVDPRPTVLVLLTRMTAIEEVHPDRYSITAQAGATIHDIQEAARHVGRRFAPDWGARGTATIGGAVSTNAGGSNVLRYGPMRHHVLGVEVVLPDGRVWNGLRALRKDVSGYDLKQLFIGAEGTLGIVTRVVVNTVTAVENELSVFAALRDLDAVMPLYALGRSIADDALTAFELVPELGVQLVCERQPDVRRPLETSADWYVLIRLLATTDVDDLAVRFLEAATEQGLIVDATAAVTEQQDANLWTIRDELIPTVVFPLYEHGLKMDTAVPIDHIAAYHDGVGRIAAELAPDAIFYAFGHVGDGNLHLSVTPRHADHVADFRRRVPELVERIDELTFGFGGTISAEHGIGQELLGRVGAQKSEIELELMWRIKDALDPAGLFNPDKVLPRRSPTA